MDWEKKLKSLVLRMERSCPFFAKNKFLVITFEWNLVRCGNKKSFHLLYSFFHFHKKFQKIMTKNKVTIASLKVAK